MPCRRTLESCSSRREGLRYDGQVHDDEPSTALPVQTETQAVKAAVYKLVVFEGPNEGYETTLDSTRPSRIYVGQSATCDIVLEDREVSRRHLALDAGERELHLVDLGSSNGTFVNDVRVTNAHLRGGEVIRFGRTAVRVELASAVTSSLATTTSFGAVLGASVAMRRLYPLCAKLAASNLPLVIEGETGTGKELLAESLHAMGPRANGPFVVFDCTAVPVNLMEAELFGHERGAFTSAVATRKGMFEQAEGGTLLIDEIGDLDLALQPKLLRAVQRSEVRRVGGDRWIHVDVRVIAATRRDLEREVQAGRFRDDLYFRLAVARVELPPLRERDGDASLLGRAFWEELGGPKPIPPDVLRRWAEDAWPGNVRELYNDVIRRVALGDLADESRPKADSNAEHGSVDSIERVLRLNLPLTDARKRVVEDFERRYIDRIVAKHGGNVVHAATASGIAHRYFQILRARHQKR